MKNCYLLVIDAGTGAAKVLLFDLAGNINGSAHREWTYKRLPEIASGAVEFDPEDFWQIIAELIREVIAASGINQAEIAAVTATSQRQGMIFIDKNGHEIYAAPNLDLRGGTVLSELEASKSEIFSITGLPLHGMFGLSRLAWFSKYDQKTYNRVHRVMMFSDWICYRLSGICASEPSVASSSQLFDISSLDYSTKLMEYLGLRKDIFPSVTKAGVPVGTVTGGASRLTGIPSGVPVCNGGGDTQAGVLGMGLYQAGQAGVVAGTTTPVIFLADSAKKYPNAGTYSNCHVIPGCWSIEANAGSTGLSLRWIKDLLLKNTISNVDPYPLIDQEASTIPIGANGMVAYIGVELAGSDPGENLGGFVFPVPWDIDEVKVGQFYRAAIEMNIYGVRANLDHLTSLTSIQPSELHLCGGQSKSQLFCQGLADVTGLSVNIYKVHEATALGASLSAACGVGLFRDIEGAVKSMVHLEHTYIPGKEESKSYKKVYERWLQIYKSALSSFRM